MYKRFFIALALSLLTANMLWAQASVTVTLNSGTTTTYNIASTGGLYFSNGNIKIATSSVSAGTVDILLSDIAHISLASNAGIENAETSHLAIYPNPVTNSFVVSGMSEGEHQIALYSIEGKMMLQTMCQNGESFNIGNLQQGIYIIRVENNVYKLIKL